MGVTNFWQLLEGTENTPVDIASCSGQKWAIDLTPWMVHARTAAAAGAGHVSESFVIMKTVFQRTLCLLKNGIIPVFVLDGREAPQVKQLTMQRRHQSAFGHTRAASGDRSGLMATNKKCQSLLEALGLTVITSAGEAEKTCAYLNQQGVVDACLTDDSDAFPYGALTVCRNLDIKKQTVERHTMKMIEDTLNLTRHDLVVMALLAGCDYNERGVPGIGPKKVCGLIKSLKSYENKVTDILHRVLDWKENGDLKALDRKEQQLLGMKKEKHCTQCDHPGPKRQHRSVGCVRCHTLEGCSETAELCDCPFHQLEREVSPYKTELLVRKKVLEKNNQFPDKGDKDLVEEFLKHSAVAQTSASLSMPDWELLPSVVSQHLHKGQEDLMKSMVPVMVHMHLHGTLHEAKATPLKILKTCKKNFVQCYQVPWERFAFDKWTPETLLPQETTPNSKEETKQDVYTVDVECELFKKKYPEMVERFNQNVNGKRASSKKKAAGKRAAEDHNQRKLTDMFPAKKRLFSEAEHK